MLSRYTYKLGLTFFISHHGTAIDVRVKRDVNTTQQMFPSTVSIDFYLGLIAEMRKKAAVLI